MAMASRPSVTVSMAEEMTGILTAISRVTRELTSVSAGSTSDGRGASSTSSKVSATVNSSRIGRCAMLPLRSAQVGRNRARPGPLPWHAALSRPDDEIAPRRFLAPRSDQGKRLASPACWHPPPAPAMMPPRSPSGGTGRRAKLKIWCSRTCPLEVGLGHHGFSHLPHDKPVF